MDKCKSKKRGLLLGLAHLKKQGSQMHESYVVKIKQLLDNCQAPPLAGLHLSRQKFIIHFLLAMITAGQVQFPEIAAHFHSPASASSRLGRIQRFFADFTCSDQWLAGWLMKWLPTGKLTLCLDPTNWQFGSVDINILALTAAYRGVGVPIFFCLLAKKGNSATLERIDLRQRFLTTFGSERIGCLIADREFIGSQWYAFLLQSQIPFFIRLPKQHYFRVGGLKLQAEQRLQKRNKCLLDNVLISGHYRSVAIKRLEDDYLIVLTNTFAHQALSTYRQRWSIETFFQSIKKRGFDLEATHLKDESRLHKWMALVALAFTACLVVGLWQHQNRKAIPLKNHGYKANSFFRHGLHYIRQAYPEVQSQWKYLEHVFQILLQLKPTNALLVNFVMYSN
jgi:hypothetical protein